jgi:2-isopropylmalate synthase
MDNTLQENLAMIADSVDFLKTNGREVVYDAEHFFDGFKDSPEYAMETLAAAFNAGADFLVLCDTNGGTLPHEVETITRSAVKKLKSRFGSGRKLKLGIHTHNDCGMAAANSLAASIAGPSWFMAPSTAMGNAAAMPT